MLRNTLSVLAGGVLAIATPAYASDPAEDPALVAAEVSGEPSAAPAAPVAAPTVDESVPELTAVETASMSGDLLSNDELGELRGGQGVVLSNQTLVAVTSGNVINGDYVAGNVSLSDNALSNFNGLGNVLINTGAQVSLQTGMNVTINVGE